MITEIEGLHHVTSLASNARANHSFFTSILGLRFIKKTVNFDAPHVYHLYYGDNVGRAGTVMTYFPFEGAVRGRAGSGEVGTTAFAVLPGALDYWKDRFAQVGLDGVVETNLFGEKRLQFQGPDGDGFALVEVDDDPRMPWLHEGVPVEAAIRGFHSASMRLNEAGASSELLRFMGYEETDTQGTVTRFIRPGGNYAHTIDIDHQPGAMVAQQGAGSVHHIAFSVVDRADQLKVRKALLDTGYQVTPVIDRQYFYAIYFRTPGGVLFEVATHEPGFAFDEDQANLGTALKLPQQHEHLRAQLEAVLPKLGDMT